MEDKLTSKPPPPPCMPFYKTLKDTAKIELYQSEHYDFAHSAIILYKEHMKYCIESGSCTESGADSGSYSELNGVINLYSTINRKKDSIWLSERRYMDMTGTKCIRDSGRIYRFYKKHIDSNSCLIRTGLYEDKKYFLNYFGDGYATLFDKITCDLIQQGLFKNHKLYTGKEYNSNHTSHRTKVFKEGNIIDGKR